MAHRLLLAGILALAALIRLWGLGGESLWHDEAWTWYLVRDSIGDLLRRVTREDAHPPLYFLLVWPWAKLGDSEAMLRLPSAILGLASLPLVHRLGRAVAGPAAGLLATAFIAVAPLHVKYSQEARSYALLFFLGALSLNLLVSRRWIALGVASAAILFTEYLGAFFLLGEAALVAAWARRERPLLRGGLKSALVALLLFLPWLPFALRHVFVVGGGFWMARTSPFVLGSEFARLLAFPYGFVDTLRTAGWAAFPAAAALAALLGLASAAFARRPETRPWALVLVVPIAALAAVGLFLPVFCARGLIYVLLPLALLAAAGEAPKALRAVAVALILLGTLPGVRFFNPSLEMENWRSAVAHLRTHAGPADLVLVDEGFLEVNVRYYWRGSDAPEILGVGERGVPPAEAAGRARGLPRVWIVRRTYFDRPELAVLLAAEFPAREDSRWHHVGVLRMSR